METMKDFGKKYEETNRHMATIASCFKIESEEAKRRMKVFNELLKIEGLSILERIKAGEFLQLIHVNVIIFTHCLEILGMTMLFKCS